MIKYKKIFLVCLIILFVSMAGVSASDSNQTDDALGVSDSGDVLGANPETFSELQSMINGNESGAIINLTDDYVANGVSIVIDKEITINGNGHILNAEGNDYILILSTPSKVTLNDLIFTNSSYKAIYSYFVETNTEINNCTFVNYTSNALGGAFTSECGGKHYFNECKFINNTCLYAAVYFADINNGIVESENKFIDCEFVNNSATYKERSGVCGIVSYLDFDLIRCNFTNNYAEEGSVISLITDTGYSSVINVNMVNSTFSGNGKGQIIRTARNYLQFVNLNISGCDFCDNNLSKGSAVFYFECPAAVNINNANFYNNNLSWASAVIYLPYETNINFTNVNITEDKRAVYVDISGNCNIKDSTFKNGVTELDGAALHVTGSGNLVVENSYFINNYAEYYIFYPRGDEIYYGSGGAVYLKLDSSSNVTFIDAVFKNNSAGIDGGAICVVSPLNRLLIIHSEFLNNTPYSNPKKDSLSPSGGGAIFISSDIDDFEISDSDFINNTAKMGGAIVYMGSEPLTIVDSEFLDNKITSVNVKIRAYSIDDVEVILTGGNTQIDAVYTVTDVVSYSNVDYSTDKGVLNTDVVYSNYSLYIPFQNVTIEFYDRTTQSMANSTNMTNEKGVAKFRNLNIENGDTIKAYHEDNTQYPYGESETTVEEMGDFNILQGLISDTPRNGVLELTRNYTFTPVLDDNLIDGITIDKDMTIIGNGFTISGLNQSRIFNAATTMVEWGPSFTVNNVTLNNISFADYNDNALYFDCTANVQIENCEFINGHTLDQSSIYLNGGNLTISNCEFINISTAHNSTYWDYATGNYYEGYSNEGNAFLYVSCADNVVISKSKFKGSNFGYNGLYIVNTENVTFDEIEVKDNLINGEQTVYNATSDTTYCNSIYYGGDYNNILLYVEALNINLSNSKFENNTLGVLGLFNSFNATVKNITVSDSLIKGGFDLMLNAEVPDSTDLPPMAYLTIEDVNVSNCNATSWAYQWNDNIANYTYFEDNVGAAIFYVEANSMTDQQSITHYGNITANIKNINVEDIIGYEKGILYTEHIYNLTLEDVTLNNINATSVSINYDTNHNKYYRQYENEGGYIIQGGFDILNVNNIFVNNTVGGMEDGCVLYINDITNGTINNVVANNIMGGEEGGVICVSTPWNSQKYGTVSINNVTATNLDCRMNYTWYDFNSGEYGWQIYSGEGGGAIFVMSQYLNVTITNIYVDRSNGGGEEGGALIIEANELFLENVTVLNSCSGGEEGGMYIYVKNNAFINNFVMDNITSIGEYEIYYDPSSNITYENVWTGYGAIGAYITVGGNLTFSNASFTNGDGLGYEGFYIQAGNITISNFTIENISDYRCVYYQCQNGEMISYNEESEGSEYCIYIDTPNENSTVNIDDLNIKNISSNVREGILQINNIANAAMNNVVIDTVKGGEEGAIYISQNYNSKNGTVLINNITVSNLDCRVNESRYNQNTGQYDWEMYMGEEGGALYVDCRNLNVTLTNFYVDNLTGGGEEGGTFVIEANELFVENVTVLNSCAGGEEGGIYIFVNNNAFINNFVMDNITSLGEYYLSYDSSSNTTYEDAWTGYGAIGAYIDVRGNLTFSNASFTNSDGLGYYGFYFEVGNITISNVTMENISNHKCIYCQYENGEITSYNDDGEGSNYGIYIITDNENSTVNINDLTVKNVSASVQDNLLYIEANNVTVDGVNISGAYSGYEGTINIKENRFTNPNSTIAVNNVYMENVRKSPGENYTQYDPSTKKFTWEYEDYEEGGAGIHIENEYANATVSNITIVNSDGGGESDGVISIDANNVELSNVLIDNITAPYYISYEYDQDWDTHFKEIESGEGGSSGIYIYSNNNVNIKNATISNVEVGGEEGGIVFDIYGKNITIDDVDIVNVTSKPYLYSRFDKSYNLYINESYAESMEVIYIYGVTNSTVNINNFNVDNIPGAQENTVVIEATNVTMTNSSFRNITSKYEVIEFDDALRKEYVSESSNEGNGVYIGAKNIDISNTSFSDMTFGGSPNYDSGHVLILDAENYTLLDNCTFENNVAKSYNYTEFNPDGSISSNITEESYGSTIKFNGKNNTIKNSRFINNTADYGGALYLTEKVNITDSEFTRNTAKLGGAIYVDNDVYNVINQTTFVENEAVDGGAIYFNITAFNNTIYNSSFIKNRAFHNGGAIYIIASNQNGVNIINQSTFDHNHAVYVGGAFYFNDTQNRMLYEDYEFYNRSALYSDGPQEFVGYHTKILDSLYELNTDYPLLIFANDSAYGRNTTAIVTIAPDAGGYVYVNITDEAGNIISDVNGNPINGEYLLVNGAAEFDLGILPVGKYNISAHYDDYEYNEPGDEYVYHINSTVFNIYPHFLNVSSDNKTIFADENVTIKAELNVNATGDVIFIFNETYNCTVPVEDGIAIANIGGFYAGTYNVNVTYLGDSVFDQISNLTVSFDVIQRESLVNVSVKNITYGEIATIIVQVPKNQTGYVTINVNDGNHTQEITNGEALFEISDLDVDKYPVTVIFQENRIYKSNNNETVFWVNKAELNPEVDGKDVSVLENPSFTISNLPGDFSGFVKIEIDGETYYDGEFSDVIETDKLLAGNKTAKVTFYGDDNYNETTLDVNFTVSRIPIDIDAEITDVVYPDNPQAIIQLSEPGNGTIRITTPDGVYEFPIENGAGTYDLSGVSAGIKDAIVEFISEDGFYENASTAVRFFVEQGNTTLTVEVDDNEDIVVNLKEDVKGNVTIIVNGEEHSVPIDNGKAVLTDVKFNEGNNSIVAIYENENYNSVYNKTTYEVPVSEKIDPSLAIDIEDNVITVDVGDNATGDVTVYVNGDEYSVPVEDGKAVLSDAVFNEGNNTITAVYAGDDSYNAGSNSAVYEVPVSEKQDPSLAIDVEDNVITVDVGDNATGDVTVYVNGDEYSVPIVDGEAVLDSAVFNEGNNSIVVVYAGDDNYNAGSNSGIYELPAPEIKNKTDIMMEIDVKDGSVIVTVPENATGSITVSVNGKKSVVPIKNGKATLDDAELVEGENTIIAAYAGDENYNGAEVKFIFNNNETEPPVIKNKTNATMDISADENSITVDVGENATGDVIVYVNDDKFIVPINNGKATLGDVEFKEGNNTVIAIYEGDDNYNGGYNDLVVNVEDNSTVVISTDDVIKYYSGPERFNVTVAYNNGTPISGVDVKITINGRSYARVTDENGIASIALNLNSGNYTVDVEVSDFNFTSKNVVEVLATIYANDVTKVFRNGTHYYGLFLDGEGNPLVNTDVSFNINGVFYNRTTNASGWARLNLNLEKGTYILTAINPVTTEMRTNIVTVISQLETSDLVKYYKNDSQFVVRVRADDGSWAGAGEVVKFNVQGRLYERETNATGHAVLKINLEPEEYIITSYYKDCREGNTITVLPVLTASDLTMKYRDGSQFKAKLVDGQGKAYAGQTITFNINGVFYNRTTDSDGVAKLNIRLMAGEYIITSMYDDARISNTIKIEA